MGGLVGSLQELTRESTTTIRSDIIAQAKYNKMNMDFGQSHAIWQGIEFFHILDVVDVAIKNNRNVKRHGSNFFNTLER